MWTILIVGTLICTACLWVACFAASDADDLAETLYQQRLADKEWLA